MFSSNAVIINQEFITLFILVLNHYHIFCMSWKIYQNLLVKI